VALLPETPIARNPPVVTQQSECVQSILLQPSYQHSPPRQSICLLARLAKAHSASMAAIGPLTIRQLNLFSHKVVLALFFEYFREAVPNEGRVSAVWRSKEDFAKEGIPPALLDIMKRYGTLQQGKWNERKIFEYRFEVNPEDGLFACIARLRGGLFVIGFAGKNASMLASDDLPHWIAPSELLGMMSNPRFEKKN
jgi:hypothetical protein